MGFHHLKAAGVFWVYPVGLFYQPVRQHAASGFEAIADWSWVGLAKMFDHHVEHGAEGNAGGAKFKRSA